MIAGRDLHLAVGEMLDQHRGEQQKIVGERDRHGRRGARKARARSGSATGRLATAPRARRSGGLRQDRAADIAEVQQAFFGAPSARHHRSQRRGSVRVPFGSGGDNPSPYDQAYRRCARAIDGRGGSCPNPPDHAGRARAPAIAASARSSRERRHCTRIRENRVRPNAGRCGRSIAKWVIGCGSDWPWSRSRH